MRSSNLNKIPTPFFLYDLSLLEETLTRASKAASRYDYFLHYAMKANHEAVITKTISGYGFGADCVSGNEIRASLDSGFRPETIAFAGVGKTDEEISLALENNIGCFNCESVEELKVVGAIAKSMGKVAKLALRVNPDINPLTHKKITTGSKENKFGINEKDLQEALDFCHHHPGIEFIGLHFHIGSQILSLDPYIDLCRKASHIWEAFSIEKYGGRMLNLGGGLGIDYLNPGKNSIPDFDSFFDVFSRNLQIPGHVKVHFELGRSLVGQCGSLISRVLYVKQGISKKMIILDAGMTELLRPALYQAMHKVENISGRLPEELYDVVGPACESSDVFARDIYLPETARGDLLAIRSCGAYAQSMSLRYNLRNEAVAYTYRAWGKSLAFPSLDGVNQSEEGSGQEPDNEPLSKIQNPEFTF